MLLELEIEMNPAQNLPWAAALDLLDKTSCLLIYRQDIYMVSRKDILSPYQRSLFHFLVSLQKCGWCWLSKDDIELSFSSDYY